LIIENESTQLAAFERKIGVGRNSFSSALSNKSSISHILLAQICKHFPQYSIDWIVYGKNSPHAQIIKLLVKMKTLFKVWDNQDWEKI
jgi:hypothetical protein